MSTRENNLALWNSVCTTNTENTKGVSMGGRTFTSIDSYYQIMRATEMFGPLGQGWGWTTDHEVILDGTANAMALVKLTLWYRPLPGTGIVQCGPVMAMNKLASAAGKPDEEAFKKATTDAVTKALSYLGFSADVFLGKFDDNRYVDGLKKQESEDKVTAPLPDAVRSSLETLKSLTTKTAITELRALIRPEVAKLEKAQQNYVALAFQRREAVAAD